jgi:hypothetical protein
MGVKWKDWTEGGPDTTVLIVAESKGLRVKGTPLIED